MTSAKDLEALIRHAEAYPYERPAGSYLYDAGAVRPLGRLRLAGRVPVIAAGSNAAPARLAVTFRDRPGTTTPATRARLCDHAVVYAAHFELYGALPATLHRVVGTASEVFLTWLTPTQLACMHASEGVGSRYDYLGLDRLALETASAGSTRRAPTSAATARWSTAGGRYAWPRCRREAARCRPRPSRSRCARPTPGWRRPGRTGASWATSCARSTTAPKLRPRWRVLQCHGQQRLRPRPPRPRRGPYGRVRREPRLLHPRLRADALGGGQDLGLPSRLGRLRVPHAEGEAIGWVDGDLGHGRAFRFEDPFGHVFEIYWDTVRYEPAPEERPALKNLAQRFHGRGCCPRRLDHLNLLAEDVTEFRRFMETCLGSRVTELIQLGNGRLGGCWFTVNNKTYDLACTEEHGGGMGRLHHVTYATDQREDILRAADIFLENGVFIETGPHKHAIQGTFFLYVWEPAGNRFELANSGARLILAPDWEPVVWTEADRKKGQAWGLKTIESFHTHGTPPVTGGGH